MILFMAIHDIQIPSPLIIKLMLLQKICQANIPRKYIIIDVMATPAGYCVFRPSSCHCVFNPIEMVWSQLKHYAQHLNISTTQPAKVVHLNLNKSDQKITKENWQNIAGFRSNSFFDLILHLYVFKSKQLLGTAGHWDPKKWDVQS